MEENLPNIMSQLNCLLEEHKQMEERSAFKSPYQSETVQNDSNSYYQSQLAHNMNVYNIQNNYYGTNYHIPQERLPGATMTKVYVNPNYTNRKPVIHINPHVQVKPSIYVNPKLIHNIKNSQNQEKPSPIITEVNHSVPQDNFQSKCTVHINPKLMTKLISKVPEEKNLQQKCDIPSISSTQSTSVTSTASVQSKFTKNNCFQKKPVISSTSVVKSKCLVTSTPVPQKKSPTNYIIRSKTKLVKNPVALKKSPNSSLVALSRRKLVRIRKVSPKVTALASNTFKSPSPLKRRLSTTGLKKSKVSPKTLILSSTNSLTRTNSLKLIRNIDKHKLHWNNKMNKVLLKSPSKKKVITTAKIPNNLVIIGGVMYRTSRTQLVRSNQNISPIKRRRNSTINKNSNYYIAKNGKKLLKLDSTKRKNNNSFVKLNTSTSSSNKSYKSNISNKVKQRSLQILRNKMRKNNQPCLLFQKFGYCANQLTGTCHKVHDKKQVAVCKKFLQGNCLVNNCLLSHNVGPEKMPTCKYFLEGCCTREKCPYLHVKVPSNSPICVEFLRGYCPQGNECQKRHIHACPEFDKSGKCSKGKSCPYPHKSQLKDRKRFRGDARRINNPTSTKQSENLLSNIVKPMKRYYDETSEDLSQKRNRLLKTVKLMKSQYEAQSSVSDEVKDQVEQSDTDHKSDLVDSQEKVENLCKKSRRPPIGPLPAYIPID